jgi:hypothetical protein
VNSAAWPLLAVGLLLAMQFTMVFTRAVNWDEFWFYYHVAEFARGTLTQPLQSFHVRLFAWLPEIPGDNVDKIVMGRMAMFACETVTLGTIYVMARRFLDKAPALLAPLLYLSAGFVFQHGFSFRTDPMATACLMASLAILLRSRLDLKALLAFALLVALAGMITIKIALYAPAFLGIAWLRWSESKFAKGTALRLVLAATATIGAFAALYAWHSHDLSESASGAGMASSASQLMFFLGIPPYWHIALKGAAFSIIFSLLIVITPSVIPRSEAPLAEKLALTGLWLPVLVPFFYLNTLAYFYAFILAPVAVACAPAIDGALKRYSVKLIALALLVITSGVFLVEDRSVIDRQHQIASVAEETFPQGIAYFDHNGMLPRFAKANWLMTPVAIQGYREAGVATYRAEMERRPVPLLLVNHEKIQDILDGSDEVLLPEDSKALRATYQPFWGPFYLAGVQLQTREQREHEFLVPGLYTVMDGAIEIDGVMHMAGAVVRMERGTHLLAAQEAPSRLQWGENLSPPAYAWEEGDIYVAY